MVRKAALVFIFILILSTVFSSCFLKKTEEEIILPQDSLFHTKEWALVTDPYTPFYKNPSEDSEIEGYVRRGDTLEIQGRRIINAKDLWYRFEKGWMPEKVVQIYSNQRKAERAASLLD